METTVINIRKKMDSTGYYPSIADYVYIGRNNRIPGERDWGNPFVIGADGTRAQVIIKYRRWLLGRLRRSESLRRDLEALRGNVLGCYCKPLACHGDVLIELLEEKKWAE